jgi:hypothetical protein
VVEGTGAEGGEGEQSPCRSRSWRHQRPQQQPEDDEHHDQDERDDKVPVMRRRPLDIQADRGGPAGLSVSPGTACTADRARSIVV